MRKYLVVASSAILMLAFIAVKSGWIEFFSEEQNDSISASSKPIEVTDTVYVEGKSYHSSSFNHLANALGSNDDKKVYKLVDFKEDKDTQVFLVTVEEALKIEQKKLKQMRFYSSKSIMPVYFDLNLSESPGVVNNVASNKTSVVMYKFLKPGSVFNPDSTGIK